MPDEIAPDEPPRETLTDVDVSDPPRPTLSDHQGEPTVDDAHAYPLGKTQPDEVATAARKQLLAATQPDGVATPARKQLLAATQPDGVATPARKQLQGATHPDQPSAAGGEHPLGTTHPEHAKPAPTEPPPPPEEEAPDATAEEVYASVPPRAKKPRNWLYIGLGSIILLALTGPLLFYFFVWRYTPTAPHHIPAGTTIAVRFDGKQLYLYEPFRTNVLGAFSGSEAASEKAKGRADRLKKHTGIDLRSDVREVIVATMTLDSWVVLVGGNFDGGRSKTKFVSSLKAFLDEEGVEGFFVDGSVLSGSGLYITQAEDTTIIIANNHEILRAASEPSDSWQTLGLSSSGALSFVVDRPVFDNASKSVVPVRDASSFQSLALSLVLSSKLKQHLSEASAHTQKVTGHLELGRKTAFHADILPTGGTTPEQLAGEWQALQADLETVSSLIPESGGLRKAMLEAKVKPGSDRVIVHAPIEKTSFDEGLVELGAKIRATFKE